MSDRHPVVGSWRVSVEVPGAGPAFVNLAMLSADGTMLVAFPSPSPAAPTASHRLEYWAPAIGSWTPSGERGAAMHFVSLGADETGAEIGTHTITATVTGSADGQGWRAPFTITITSATGATLGAVSGTVNAARIPATANIQ